MSVGGPIFIFLIFVGMIWYIMEPFLSHRTRTNPSLDETITDLNLKKRSLYRQIKELEMDYEVGNIMESDYTQSRLELKRDVSDIIDHLKKLAA